MIQDDRWGDYIPWFLRHSEYARTGDFDKFFSRIGQRLERAFKFNELEISNSDYFGACLESESLQRFQHSTGEHLNTQIRKFFEPNEIHRQTAALMFKDKEQHHLDKIEREYILRQILQNAQRSNQKSVPVLNDDAVKEARKNVESTRNNRFELHFSNLVRERLGVVEVLLRLLPDLPSAKKSLISDICKYFAEANIPLTIRGNPPLIVPFEETLLEHEVIGKLLPRLEAQFPERAKELIDTYHALFTQTKTLDSIFSEAFKTLEEIARTATDNPKFMFDQKNMNTHFGRLHPTVIKTITNLAAHRGDEAGHGKSAPEPEEIRYLLFQICNIALLILDYSNT